MIIQEPIKATIWFALENYAYSDAIFLAERLYAEVNTEENLYLLATAYYRSGKHNIAHSILTRNKYDPRKSPNCHFLRAKCCYQLGRIGEAANILLEPITNRNNNVNNDDDDDDDNFDNIINRIYTKEELIEIYGEQTSFVAQLLGQLFNRLEDIKTSIHYYTLSLKLNPFLWHSYEKLLQIDPSEVDNDKLFNVDNLDLRYTHGTNPLINLFNKNISLASLNDVNINNNDHNVNSNNKIRSTINNNNNDNRTTSIDTSHSYVTPEIRKPASNNEKKPIHTPYAIIKQSSNTNKVDIFTPESDGQWKMTSCLAPTKNMTRNPRKFANTQNHQNTNSSQQVLTETLNTGSNRNQQNLSSGPLFGVLCLDQESVNISNKSKNHNSTKMIGLGLKESNHQQETQMILDNDEKSMVHVPITTNNSSSILTRRSSRLINSDTRSLRENTASGKKINDLKIGVTPVKRCRRTISFDKSKKLAKQNNENDSSMPSLMLDLEKTGAKAERSSANGLIELIKVFANAYKRLAEYRCKDAIELFKNLPAKHFNTGFVLSMIGRCYFNMGAHEQAINYFKICRQIEPYRLQGLEIYSTALWHLQKELELSCLSQELIRFDKLSPETWCVAGNCFSLQKDHEISIKFLKRAIQVDPNFAYAYTLLGHELISADELDNAMSCFMNAKRIDPRHYNAWCGIGLIYYKQEKYDLAYQHYKHALEISPYNPVLMCHVGIIMHHLKKSNEAIEFLNKASNLDPENVHIKYHRALIRFYLEEYDSSLRELEELRTMVPKESMVFFLIGKIHKLRGKTDDALLNFSWAVNIDPKGTANQHKEFTEPNQTSPEEIIIHSGNADALSSERSPTPIPTTPFAQRSTFVTSSINSNYHNINNSTDEDRINDLIGPEMDEDEDDDDDDEQDDGRQELESFYSNDSNAMDT